MRSLLLFILVTAPAVAMANPAPVALPKVGSCPSGYMTSGDYCLSSR